MWDKNIITLIVDDRFWYKKKNQRKLHDANGFAKQIKQTPSLSDWIDMTKATNIESRGKVGLLDEVRGVYKD